MNQPERLDHDCSECWGAGYHERCVNGHIGNCPCVAEEWRCSVCKGTGLCQCGACQEVRADDPTNHENHSEPDPQCEECCAP